MADSMSKRLDQKGKTPSVKKTRKMPSGAQQYVRGETTSDRLDTLIGLDRGGFRSSKMPFGPERRKTFDMESGRVDAFIDESKKSSEDYRKKKARGYKDGGAVCQGGGKAMAGTKFRGVR